MRRYGLIGEKLPHSFSPAYFSAKFKAEHIPDASYTAWELPSIDRLPELVRSVGGLRGFNVTIPYKTAVCTYLDKLSGAAADIFSVNTVVVRPVKPEDGVTKIPGFFLEGFNTDVIGFRESVRPLIPAHCERALLLGTGGSSVSVAYVLRQIGIEVLKVSRTPEQDDELAWEQVNEYVIKYHPLIVNSTPVGQFPQQEQCPPLPYEAMGTGHVLYDLIYNPPETLFLKRGREQGALTQNGHAMLVIQAEESWKIWQEAV